MTQDLETLSRHWGTEFVDDLGMLRRTIHQPLQPRTPEPPRVYRYAEVVSRLFPDALPRQAIA
jgi:hypothetical protein